MDKLTVSIAIFNSFVSPQRVIHCGATNNGCLQDCGWSIGYLEGHEGLLSGVSWGNCHLTLEENNDSTMLWIYCLCRELKWIKPTKMRCVFRPFYSDTWYNKVIHYQQRFLFGRDWTDGMGPKTLLFEIKGNWWSAPPVISWEKPYYVKCKPLQNWTWSITAY